MQLYTSCTSCSKSIILKSKAKTRPNLQMKKGDSFNLNCQNCGKMQNTHVNDIKAESSKTTLMIVVFIALICTLVLWQFYGVISSLAGAIIILFVRQQQISTKAFNGYMIRRK